MLADSALAVIVITKDSGLVKRDRGQRDPLLLVEYRHHTTFVVANGSPILLSAVPDVQQHFPLHDEQGRLRQEKERRQPSAPPIINPRADDQRELSSQHMTAILLSPKRQSRIQEYNNGTPTVGIWAASLQMGGPETYRFKNMVTVRLSRLTSAWAAIGQRRHLVSRYTTPIIRPRTN